MQVLRLLHNDRGGVAPIFALAIIPMMALVGAAVDYSRANSVKVALQAALDATSLAIAKEAPSLTQAQLQTKATAFFQTNFNRPEAKNLSLTATYSTAGGSQLVIAATTNVDTAFMQIMGFPQLNVGSSSTVVWGSQRLRVALALDITGSMDSAGKMTALKTATKNLLNQLQTAATTNGDVYVSIIPFNKNVNVGSSNYNANWIDWTDWESEPANLKTSKPLNWSSIGPGDTCPFTTLTHGFRCTTTPTGTTTTTTIPSGGTYSGYICPSADTGGIDAKKIGIIYNGCYNSVYAPKTVATGLLATCFGYTDCTCTGSGTNRTCKQDAYTHTWVVNARSTWNGCITDRGTTAAPSGNYDRQVTTPSSGTPATLFPAEQNSYCGGALSPLSYNWTAMKTMVDNLYPLGATNQPIGLVWGWQSLVGGGPFSSSPAKDSQYTYREVVVLMSDGLNTLNRWYGNGSTTNTSVDARMYESSTVGTCANIKAAGITIYTIHVNTDGDPQSTLLKNCATDADKFWMVTSASGIGTVFTQIGTQLSKLRIAK